MKHDPEKRAASFLLGEMNGRRRVGFEQHIVECEDCWREVQLGRAGRSLAESGRELAPQDTRENVRAVIAAFSPPPRRWRPGWGVTLLAGIALVLALASVGYLGVRRSSHPPAIEAVLADYRKPVASGSIVETELPRRLGDLRYVTSYATTAEGLDITAHAYQDAAGHKVIVYQSRTTFPAARGAEHSADDRTWSAAVDGVVLFCADHPVPSLVVGDDAREVTLVVGELGLK